MTRVIYGITSAAFSSVKELVEVGNGCPNVEIVEAIRNNFYVDDYLSGTASIEAAKERVQTLCDELTKYDFQLRKWPSSNFHLVNTTSSIPLRQ